METYSLLRFIMECCNILTSFQTNKLILKVNRRYLINKLAQIIYPPTLPFTQLVFKDNETVLVGGYDRKPATLTINNGWRWNGFLTTNVSSAVKQTKSAIKSLTSKFEQKGISNNTIKGVSTQEDPNGHITAICGLSLIPGSKGTHAVSNDTNGTINIWKL